MHKGAKRIIGRGAQIAPPNRYERVAQTEDLEQLPPEEVLESQERRLPTEFLPNHTRRLICENDSPDIGFRYSINPYRGCEHGCAYCYARPTHELMGLNAGIDFETKILVKHDAPQLLRAELGSPRWRPETIVISGVTDCYQPGERKYKITRGCLEVMLEARHPVGIISKNVLMLRDLDIIRQLAERQLIRVFLSITTLDAELARTMEPRTATPAAKLRAIRELTDAGVSVGIMVAPIVPGLTDAETPAILKAAAEAGAQTAGYVLLRLPLTVEPVFDDWLKRSYPLKAERVLSLIRSTRRGRMYTSEWRVRQRGEGPYAEQIGQNFKVFARRYGLDGSLPDLDCTQFQPPRQAGGQMQLF